MALDSPIYDTWDEKCILISPNIGIPQIISSSTQSPMGNNIYIFEMNLIADESLAVPEIYAFLENQISAVPLFELDSISKRMIRGKPIPIGVSHVEVRLSLTLGSQSLHDIYALKNTRPSFLLRHNFFGKRKQIIYATGMLNLENNLDVSKFLEKNAYIMFDLYQHFDSGLTPENGAPRICYHALVIRNIGWQNFKFAQITDLHVAKRFDELLGMLIPKTRIFSADISVHFLHRKTLVERYKNPNNNFRKFISWANIQNNQNQIDFILVTGDIIDYYLKNSSNRASNYNLPESNWEIFLNILLNFPSPQRGLIEYMNIYPQEELTVPIFTLPGNHDVRIYSYPLNSSKLYRHFGLNMMEANLYSDPLKKRRWQSLTIDKYSLQPYYQHINPFDDYFLEFGSNKFVLMNTRADSFLNLRNLLMANPNSKGFSDRQAIFMKNVGQKLISHNENDFTGNFFLISHAPLLNPIIKKSWKRKISEYLHKEDIFHIDEYKERRLAENGFNCLRSDPFLDFDYGVIKNNRVESLSLMLKYKMINLAGHTHLQNEFRFVISENDVSGSQPFAIYWDDYTKLYPESFLNSRKPLVFQTPSLGIGRAETITKQGAFRLIHMENDLTVSNKVYYLSHIYASYHHGLSEP